MKILIDIDLLITKGLTLEEYAFSYLINSGSKGHFQLSRYDTKFRIPEHVIVSMEEKGLVKYTTEGKTGYKSVFSIIENRDAFSVLTETDILADWIQDWVDLWPKGIKTAGYRVRPTTQEAGKKLRTFRTLYPSYDKKVIMEASEGYIQRFAINGYSFMKLAKYFIMKDGESELASECDAVLDEDYLPMLKGKGYGEQEL
jgi:hypothetical protein